MHCHPDQREQTAAGRRRGRARGTARCAERAGAPEGGDDDFDEAAREEHEHEPRSDGGGCRCAEQRVEHPSPARRGPAHARPDEVRAGAHRDRGDGGTRAGSGAEDPGGRCGREEQRGEAEDEHESRRDERDAADDGTARDRRRATRRRWRAGSMPVRAAGCTPRSRPRTRAALIHCLRSTQSSRSSAMCAGGPPNPMQPIRPHCPTIVRSDGRADASGVRGAIHRPPVGAVSDRPAGTARRRCPTGPGAGSACRPGPSTMSLRNRAPASRSRATSASRSSTMKWMRFQPPGPGLAPSGIGRPAELAGPGEQQPEVAPLDVGERGRSARQELEAEQLRVEGDRLVDVVDHVADVDGLIVRHASTSSSLVRPAGGAGSRCASRARPRCARTRGSEARLVGPSSAGSGMLQCTSSRVRRELRADLADAVAQRDHHVEALRDELVEVLGAVRADVDAALAA